jgi:DNA-binding SARP family transcriptional activator
VDAQVRIRLCGPIAVERDGRVLAGRELGSRKARTLLGLLAVERGHLVTTDRIVDLLWTGDAPRDPAANVATLVSRLRAVLGEGVLQGSRSGYGLLDGGAWSVDVDRARHLVDEAAYRFTREEPALALAAASAALDLLGIAGLLDDDPLAEWASAARAEAEELRRRARHLAADAAIATADPATAQRLARTSVEADPLDEQARRDLMRALVADGQAPAALEVFADLARTLRQELGADPDAETTQLHLAVLRGVAPPAPPMPSSRRRTPDTALVGRQEDLAVVEAAWTAAAGGDPGLVLVVGEAGIGKSRLLAEAAVIAERIGGTVLSGRCHAAERSLFLQPVIDALRPALLGAPADLLIRLAGDRADALVSLMPELREVVGTASGGGRPPEWERRRAYEVVAQVMVYLSQQAPLLLLLDDLQEAGTATIDLLDFLARRLDRARVLIVGAVRSEDQQVANLLVEQAVVLELGPLPASAVAAMVAAAGETEHTERIMARTRGHPLSVVEMLRALSAGETGVPQSFSQAVLARLSRAGVEAGETLGAASILGVGVDPRILAGLMEETEVRTVRRCEDLVRARLLVPSGRRYEFVNDLVQEVVHASLPTPLMHAYHRRAADLLSDRPEAMAHHAEVVGDTLRAAQGWLLAGEEAMRRHSARDAADLFDRACLAAQESGHTRVLGRAHLARARALEALTEYARALDDIEEALRLARDADDRRLEMIALRARGGDVPVALHHPITEWTVHIGEGLHLAAALGDRGAESDFSARLAVAAAGRLRLSAALAHGRRALATGRALGDEGVLAVGLDGLKTALAYLGYVDELAEVTGELEPLLRRRSDNWFLQWCVFESSFVAAARGDWAAARRRIDESIELALRSPWTTYVGNFVAHRGWMARLAGDLPTALVEGRQAVEQTSSVDHPWWYATATGLLAASLVEAGRGGDAEEVAAQGAAFVGAGAAEAFALRVAAPLAAAGGTDESLLAADAMVSAIDAPPDSAWVVGADAYLLVAQAWASRGERDRAAATLAPLLAATGPNRWAAVHDRARSVLSPA